MMDEKLMMLSLNELVRIISQTSALWYADYVKFIVYGLLLDY